MEKQRNGGQILFLAFQWVHGGIVVNRRKKEIYLDLIVSDDEAVLAKNGLTALRQGRILRLSSQASEQGAVLTYSDLVQLLSTSLSTIKRDLRELKQAGFLVPIYRRRGRRILALLIPAILFLLFSSRARAQISSTYGSVGFDYEYENQRSEDTSTSRHRFFQQYNLGIDGRILDPRLATFFLSGAFNSSFFGEQNTRATSFTGSLSLLQGAPYGLTLRGGRTFASGGVDTEGSTLGANLRITFPDLPQIFMDFDRVTIESRGDSRSDTSITTGRLRFSHRFWKTMLDGEVGVQNFSDAINDRSQDRYFARLNNTVAWSPTTTLRSVNDGFLQGNQLILGTSYSIENRPDPTLSRSASFSYRSSKTGEDQNHSLSLSGALSKTYFPYPWLQANAFTSAIAQKSFGSEDPAGVAWSGGSSTVISYFRPVSILADYALAVSYQTDIGTTSTTQQAHLGAVSRTLDPLRLSGDYYFGYQTGLTSGARQFVVGRADATLTPQLSLRAVADFLHESLRSSALGDLSTTRSVANIGGGASYRPFFNLTLDASGNLEWTNSPNASGTLMRADMRISYHIPITGTPTLNINGIWERGTVTDDSRLEVRSRLDYRFGQATISLEHRFERQSVSGSTGLLNSIRLNFVRPFRIAF